MIDDVFRQLAIDGMILDQVEAGAGATVFLFSNDVLLSDAKDLPDLTPITAAGLSETGNIAAWEKGVDVASGLDAIFPTTPIMFTAGGADLPITAFGYAVKKAAGGIIAAQRFDTPRTFMETGDTIAFLPGIRWKDQIGG
jgi:hypothetical protein